MHTYLNAFFFLLFSLVTLPHSCPHLYHLWLCVPLYFFLCLHNHKKNLHEIFVIIWPKYVWVCVLIFTIYVYTYADLMIPFSGPSARYSMIWRNGSIRCFPYFATTNSAVRIMPCPQGVYNILGSAVVFGGGSISFLLYNTPKLSGLN